jgi:predicted ATPase
MEFQLEFSKEKSLTVESKYDVKNQDESEIPIHKFSMNVGKTKFFSKENFLYLSADRISPEDSYTTNKSSIDKKHFGNRGEFAPHYYQVHKNDIIPIKELAYDDEKVFSLEFQLNKWLGVISPGIQVHTEIHKNLVILQYSYKTKLVKTSEYKAKNAGFGITYVFSVLVAFLSAHKGDTIIIENPESHIHPRGQSELARLMALAAKNGVQIFIETHSDHIIYGLRIAIKEKDIDKNEVQIYYFDRDKEEHFSIAHHIKIDDMGRMDRDCKEYFMEYENHLDKLLG